MQCQVAGGTPSVDTLRSAGRGPPRVSPPPAPPRPRPDSWLAADQQRGHARFGCARLLVLVPNLAADRLETVDPDMSTRED